MVAGLGRPVIQKARCCVKINHDKFPGAVMTLVPTGKFAFL
jgi:hypothetical protein